MIETTVLLGKVLMKMDQPNAAIKVFDEQLKHYPDSIPLLIGLARIHDTMNNFDESSKFYKQVLQIDPSNIEALALIAGNAFYTDQPEISLIYYRRLLQLGVNSAELWTNIGICAFYSQYYDIALNCIDRALLMAKDEDLPDIWYNIGHIALGLGDTGLAYQSWKIAIAYDHHHAESLNNLGVLESRKQVLDLARSNWNSSMQHGEHLYEPHYNAAKLAYDEGQYQESLSLVSKALELYPGHYESQELQKILHELYSIN